MYRVSDAAINQDVVRDQYQSIDRGGSAARALARLQNALTVVGEAPAWTACFWLVKQADPAMLSKHGRIRTRAGHRSGR
jgi:hypothetical protein